MKKFNTYPGPRSQLQDLLQYFLSGKRMIDIIRMNTLTSCWLLLKCLQTYRRKVGRIIVKFQNGIEGKLQLKPWDLDFLSEKETAFQLNHIVLQTILEQCAKFFKLPCPQDVKNFIGP